MSRGLAVSVVVVLFLAPVIPSYADTIELPGPQSDQLNGVELFEILGTARDQLPGYILPGAISNDELVQVEVSGDGAVQRIQDEQRIGLIGSGDYFIREAGPARAAVALGDERPVLNFGDIIWQGFSTGSRRLGAHIELDPSIESDHLPLQVKVSFTSVAGRQLSLGPGERLPGPGTVTLTVSNSSKQQTVLPTAKDVAAGPVAALLDRMVAAANSTAIARLPTNRSSLPPELAVTGATTRPAVQLMPLQLRGTLSAIAENHTGPDPAERHPNVVRLDTLLEGTSTFSLAVAGPGRLALDLSAVPALDARMLAPPGRFHSWSAWAENDPPIAERRAALDLLVQTAATGSRASAYSPYLGSQLGDIGRTTFHFALASLDASMPAGRPLRSRPLPIGLAILSALVLLAFGAVVWRRS